MNNRKHNIQNATWFFSHHKSETQKQDLASNNRSKRRVETHEDQGQTTRFPVHDEPAGQTPSRRPSQSPLPKRGREASTTIHSRQTPHSSLVDINTFKIPNSTALLARNDQTRIRGLDTRKFQGAMPLSSTMFERAKKGVKDWVRGASCICTKNAGVGVTYSISLAFRDDCPCFLSSTDKDLEEERRIIWWNCFYLQHR